MAPAARAEAGAVGSAERMHRLAEDELVVEDRGQIDLVLRIERTAFFRGIRGMFRR